MYVSHIANINQYIIITICQGHFSQYDLHSLIIKKKKYDDKEWKLKRLNSKNTLKHEVVKYVLSLIYIWYVIQG